MALRSSGASLNAPGSQPANVYGMPTPGEGVKVGFHGIGDEARGDGPDAAGHDLI